MNYISDEIDRLKIEKNIHDILYLKKTPKFSIEWGMNYITFSPSKRIRPLILLEANLIFSRPDRDAYMLASAVELVHTYSLVHDDLPCMDNDDLRRGVRTLHKLRNEAYALLVGDALLTRSLEILSGYSKKELLPEILKVFGAKGGCAGMIRGQMIDLEGEKKRLKAGEIMRMYRMKTSCLFELSLLCGAINGGAGKKDLSILEKLGESLGLAFQLKDDILDITGNEKLLGKKTGSDEKNKKSSVPLVLGLEKSEALLSGLKKDCMRHIDKLPGNREFFLNLLDFIISREK